MALVLLSQKPEWVAGKHILLDELAEGRMSRPAKSLLDLLLANTSKSTTVNGLVQIVHVAHQDP